MRGLPGLPGLKSILALLVGVACLPLLLPTCRCYCRCRGEAGVERPPVRQQAAAQGRVGYQVSCRDPLLARCGTSKCGTSSRRSRHGPQDQVVDVSKERVWGQAGLQAGKSQVAETSPKPDCQPTGKHAGSQQAQSTASPGSSLAPSPAAA